MLMGAAERARCEGARGALSHADAAWLLDGVADLCGVPAAAGRPACGPVCCAHTQSRPRAEPVRDACAGAGARSSTGTQNGTQVPRACRRRGGGGGTCLYQRAGHTRMHGREMRHVRRRWVKHVAGEHGAGQGPARAGGGASSVAGGSPSCTGRHAPPPSRHPAAAGLRGPAP